MKPHELRQLAASKLTEANGIVELARTEKRNLTADESTKIDGLMSEAKTLQADAERLEALEKATASLSKVESRPAFANESVSIGAPRFEEDPMRGFKSSREFFVNVIEATKSGRVTDERLRSLTAGSDEHGAYSDAHGGFLMPAAMVLGLKTTDWEGDPTAGLTTSVPMSVPSVEFPARVDKNHSTSVSGGFRVYRVAETQTVTESRMELEKITLTADELMGVTFATKKIIDYSAPSIVPIIEAGFRDEFGSKIIDEKFRGTGVGQMLGFLNSPALITVTAETGQGAGTIVYKNVVNMRARSWRYKKAIWLYNPDILPQLMTMTNPAGHLIWSPPATEDAPDRLLGRPMYETEACSALGTAGDLILITPSEYLEGTLAPIEGASSIHVRFLNNETAFRFTMSNAGAPWWRSVLTPKNSGATKSPFVVLSSTRT